MGGSVRDGLRREKRYVEVISDTSEDGTITPLTIIWKDGRRFDIDKVIGRRQAYSFEAGGGGMRYTIRVGKTETYLFHENPKWFVAAKEIVLPDW